MTIATTTRLLLIPTLALFIAGCNGGGGGGGGGNAGGGSSGGGSGGTDTSVEPGGGTAPGGDGTAVDRPTVADPDPTKTATEQANSGIGDLTAGDLAAAALALGHAEAKGSSEATFFRGAAEILSFADASTAGADPLSARSLRSTESRLADLLATLGIQITYEGTGRKLWDISGATQPPSNEDDAVPATARPAGEYIAWIRDALRPRLVRLHNQWARVPAGFRYRLELSVDGQGDVVAPGTGTGFQKRIIDSADALLLRAAVKCHLAMIDVMLAYDHANADPNRFDGQQKTPSNPYLGEDRAVRYAESLPTLGRLASDGLQRLQSARRLVREAFLIYKQGMDGVRQRTGANDDHWITLGRDAFDTQGEQQSFLNDEVAFRAFVTTLTSSMDGQWSPVVGVDGKPIPAKDRGTIDFGKFFDGVDLRDLVLTGKVVPVPVGDQTARILGVGSLDAYTATMAQGGGVVKVLDGRPITAGDGASLDIWPFIPASGPAVVGASAIVVDGAVADWEGKGTLISMETSAAKELTFAMPEIKVAVTNTDLLFLVKTEKLNADLALPAGFSRPSYIAGYKQAGMVLQINGKHYASSQDRWYTYGSQGPQSRIWGKDGVDITVSDQGAEIAIPRADLPTALPLEISIGVFSWDGTSSRTEFDYGNPGSFQTIKTIGWGMVSGEAVPTILPVLNTSAPQ